MVSLTGAVFLLAPTYAPASLALRLRRLIYCVYVRKFDFIGNLQTQLASLGSVECLGLREDCVILDGGVAHNLDSLSWIVIADACTPELVENEVIWVGCVAASVAFATCHGSCAVEVGGTHGGAEGLVTLLPIAEGPDSAILLDLILSCARSESLDAFVETTGDGSESGNDVVSRGLHRLSEIAQCTGQRGPMVALVHERGATLAPQDGEHLVSVHELVETSRLMAAEGHLGIEHPVGLQLELNSRSTRRSELDPGTVAQLSLELLREADLVAGNPHKSIATPPSLRLLEGGCAAGSTASLCAEASALGAWHELLLSGVVLN